MNRTLGSVGFKAVILFVRALEGGGLGCGRVLRLLDFEDAVEAGSDFFVVGGIDDVLVAVGEDLADVALGFGDAVGGHGVGPEELGDGSGAGAFGGFDALEHVDAGFGVVTGFPKVLEAEEVGFGLKIAGKVEESEGSAELAERVASDTSEDGDGERGEIQHLLRTGLAGGVAGGGVAEFVGDNGCQFGFVVRDLQGGGVDVDVAAGERESSDFLGFEEREGNGEGDIGVAGEVLADAVDVFGDDGVFDEPGLLADFLRKLFAEGELFFEAVKIDTAGDFATADGAGVAPGIGGARQEWQGGEQSYGGERFHVLRDYCRTFGKGSCRIRLMRILCGLLGLAALAADGGMDAGRLARIPVRMKEFVDGQKTAGVVTLVARHGQIVAFEAVGYADLEAKTPMRKDTIFRIASLTKPVTCAGIMVLVDAGRISVMDPVEKYLPEFKGQKVTKCTPECAAVAPSRPITIADLMTHTSGLPSGGPTESAGKATLLFEPGTSWKYSNLGYATLGRIIEVVSGKTYDAFLAEKLFVPLGMKDTTFFPSAAQKARVAALYTDKGTTLERAVQREKETLEAKVAAPEGGLFSTAEDMFRFNQMVLNKGTLDGKRVLSAAAIELMATSLTGDLKTGFAPGVGHGFGYEVVRNGAATVRYNSVGSVVKGGAYRTYEFVDFQKDMVGVLMMQRTNGNGDVSDEINAFLTMAAGAIEK